MGRGKTNRVANRADHECRSNHPPSVSRWKNKRRKSSLRYIPGRDGITPRLKIETLRAYFSPRLLFLREGPRRTEKDSRDIGRGIYARRGEKPVANAREGAIARLNAIAANPGAVDSQADSPVRYCVPVEYERPIGIRAIAGS